MEDIDEHFCKNLMWMLDNDVEPLQETFSYNIQILGETYVYLFN